MRLHTFFLLSILLLCNSLVQGQVPSDVIAAPFTIGQTLTFQSVILKEQRTINVYLPASYSKEKAASYPVIYLLDGSKDEDFIHIAGLVQFGNFPWAPLLPESIVVGIANVDRKRDFTYPTTLERDKKEFPTTGGSEAFIDFLEKELQPLIEKQYRTKPLRTIIGQSLGGLLATEILWKRPQLFENYVIVSPSLWWDDESILSSNRVTSNSTKKVFVAVGKEGPIMEKAALGLVAKLKTEKNMKTSFVYLDDLDHTNLLHIAVYKAFEALFKKEENTTNHD